ncbi:MAG: hypothetical protein JO291_00220, partial [Acidimicrobiia bacterium]|nr:hypothetical protein [Acidimicrobiia bacterium]
MARRSLFVITLAVLAASIVACEPATKPPEVTAYRNGPVTFGPDRGAGAFALASEGDRRVAVWADQEEALYLDRFDGSTLPVDSVPTTLATGTIAAGTSWARPVVVLGGGSTLLKVVQDESEGDFESMVISLRDASGDPVALHGAAAADLRSCPEDQFGLDAFVDIAWNGTTFLWAKACTSTIELFTITPSGAVTRRGTVPTGAARVDLASAGGAFLVTYARGSSAYGWRISADGEPIGDELLMADAGTSGSNPVAAGAGGRYLVAWESQGAHGHEAVARTVQTNGVRGPVTDVNDFDEGQTDIALAGRPNGTWEAAWTDTRDGDEAKDIVGTLVSASGEPADPFGTALAPQPGNQFRASLASGRGGSVVLAWSDDATGATINLTRTIDVHGNANGVTSQPTRAPFSQLCPDAAAGNGQYLVTWQEPRTIGGTNLYARRFGADGSPRGGLITLSSAAADQTCPMAAWNGTNWLVVWTDQRTGNKDVYGALVYGNGAVTPTTGFAISARRSEQQSPAVAWNGTDFVVAWNDLRNGTQDIYAARVTPGRTVRDPNGIAVTTAAGPQQAPSVVSSGGRTLIAWSRPFVRIERRILRTDGTFTGPVVNQAAARGPFVATAASGTRFAVLYEADDAEAGEYAHDQVIDQIDASSGATVSSTPVDRVPENGTSDEGDVAYDGHRFVYSSGVAREGSVASTELGTVTGTTVSSRQVEVVVFGGGRLASLPNGSSLLVSTLTRTLTVGV